MKFALAALLLFSVSVYSEDGDPTGSATASSSDEERTAAVEDMRKQLADNPGLQGALAERVLRSRIGGTITQETDPVKQHEAIAAWIKNDPGSAAEIAIGLSRDDASGNHSFENGIVEHMNLSYRRNDRNVNRGAMGVLKGAAKTSKLMNLQENEKVGEEERRELLRNLFEGKGAQSGKTIEGSAPEGKAGESNPTPSAALATSFYDRLTAGNIRGYSPQLMALQSSLNTRRPPGAPALIETGKLDYATLSYPAYGLRFDLGNLEARLRRSRIQELAVLSGTRVEERDLQDPGLEAKLLAKLPAGKQPKSTAARTAALERAKAALTAFEDAAAKSKDPNQISKALLVELSGRQREASRWVTAASLEEELARIEQEEGFLTPELLAAIDAVPAPAPARESYKRRGEQYKARLAQLKSNARASLDALESTDWLKKIAEIEKMMGESARLRGTLSRDISDYRLVPFRVGEAVLKQPRWREMLDNLLVRYASSTSYGQAVASRRGKLSRFLSIFGQIAVGDLAGAHLALVNAEGGRR